jgi:hypothetical protein
VAPTANLPIDDTNKNLLAQMRLQINHHRPQILAVKT